MPTRSRTATHSAGPVWCAFVDESMRLTPDDQGTYLPAAVVTEVARCEEIRQTLRSLLYRGRCACTGAAVDNRQLLLTASLARHGKLTSEGHGRQALAIGNKPGVHRVVGEGQAADGDRARGRTCSFGSRGEGGFPNVLIG